MNSDATLGEPTGIRILVADDHPILREGVKLLVRRIPNAEVVGEASDGFEVIRLARELKPDLIILDIQMPRMNGLHAARRIRQENPAIKILALSAQEDVKIVRLLLLCGVSGYIRKNDFVSEMVDAVRIVREGGIYLSSRFPKLNLKDLATVGGKSNPLLNARQREIQQLKRSGATVEAIAETTMLSVRTVERHLRRIAAIEPNIDAN